MSSELVAQLSKAILDGDESAASTAANKAIEAGADPLGLIKQGIDEPLDKIGKAFQSGELFLPELILSGDAAKAASDIIMPHISAEARERAGEVRAVLGTIQGDMHDIGKNMVALMLQVNGFDVIDIGINVPPKEALNRARDEGADILGLSSLMTTSMPYMKECVEMRDGFRLKDPFSIIVGGAPITAEYAAEIGADSFGNDAIEAVEKYLALLDRPA